MLPRSRLMTRPAVSNEKTVFAPMRVMVRSAAVSSVRDSAPVRTRSGALTRALSFAGAGVAAPGGSRFTSLTISVTVLSVRGAACTHGRDAASTAARTVVVFMLVDRLDSGTVYARVIGLSNALGGPLIGS